MAVGTVSADSHSVRPAASTLASALFLAGALGLSFLDGAFALTIYGVSYWHYCLYFLAYRYGVISPRDFQRDALLMKSAALAAFGWVYLAAPLHWCSLLIVLIGFSLNAVAAAVLGTDRTYYGAELMELPPLRVSTFPFSWIAHPMLAGNMLAFSATLLNPEFRVGWWLLAGVHVFLNFGLLLLERYVEPLRGGRSRSTTRPAWRRAGECVCLPVAGALLGGWLATASGRPDLEAPAAAFAAGASLYALILFRCYSEPRS